MNKSLIASKYILYDYWYYNLLFSVLYWLIGIRFRMWLRVKTKFVVAKIIANDKRCFRLTHIFVFVLWVWVFKSMLINPYWLFEIQGISSQTVKSNWLFGSRLGLPSGSPGFESDRRTKILRSLSWFGYSSGLLSFKKPETVLWTIAKHYYYYYYYSISIFI